MSEECDSTESRVKWKDLEDKRGEGVDCHKEYKLSFITEMQTSRDQNCLLRAKITPVQSPVFSCLSISYQMVSRFLSVYTFLYMSFPVTFRFLFQIVMAPFFLPLSVHSVLLATPPPALTHTEDKLGKLAQLNEES